MGQNRITGSVSDTQGSPIAGAEVYLKELQLLTVSDAKGGFVFESVAGGKFTLVVYAYEFQVYEQELTFDRALEVTIQLLPIAETALSEVVLTQEREKVFALQKLKAVEGTAIYAG